MLQDRVHSVNRLWTSDFSKGGQWYDSTRNYGVVLKLEKFFFASSRSFGLNSPIGLGFDSQ